MEAWEKPVNRETSQQLSELKAKTLRQLRTSRTAMLRHDYLLGLEKLTKSERHEAAWQLARVQLAYLQLRQARLTEIGDLLLENEAALTAGISALQNQLAKLEKVQLIAGAVKDFINLVGRVVALRLN